MSLFASVICSNTVRYLSLLQVFELHLMCKCKFLRFSVFVFFPRVLEIQLRSAVEYIQKPYRLRTRSLLVLLYFVCLIFFLSNASMCTHIRGVRKCYTLPFTRQMTSDIDRINNAIQEWKTMGKIPARGFITRLYSATVPIASRYAKKYVNRAKLTPQCVYTLC